MLSYLPSIVVLGLAALAAFALATKYPSPPENASERQAAARALIVALSIQSIHFAEEAVTGFHEQLGPVFGLPDMPFSIFIVFNLAWIGIWIASVPGIRTGHGAAYFAAWFLAIAGMVNGIAHPMLAVVSGRYFPGLATSPVIALASVWLWLRLQAATRARRATTVAD